MLVGSKQKLIRIDSNVNIVIDNTKIKRVKSSKSLGVLLDENLPCGAHINSISKKMSSGIGALKTNLTLRTSFIIRNHVQVYSPTTL